MQQAGHMLDLIFMAGIDVDLEAIDAVPWSDCFALKISPTPHVGGKLTYACLQRLMEPVNFQEAVQDINPM